MTTTFKSIQNLCFGKLGCDPNYLSKPVLEKKIQQRMLVLGIASMDEYSLLIHKSKFELQELIELIIVPETWFFRDASAFQYLKAWCKTHGTSYLRILSAPCSSGEEPYSIAMTLYNAAFPLHNFWIDAIDISSKSLAKAEAGIYSQNSFRTKQLWFRDRYFEQHEKCYCIKSLIKKSVHFSYGNITDDNFHKDRVPYHIIFCRNFLIYLSIEMQQQVLSFLDHLLFPGGLLFVGSAETTPIKLFGYAPIGPQDSYAFVKSTSENKYDALTVSLQPKELLVAKAQSLSQSKFYDQAKHLCIECLKTYGPNVESYYLLGTIERALGRNESAAGFFNAAVSLDPSHQGALFFLERIREERTNDKITTVQTII